MNGTSSSICHRCGSSGLGNVCFDSREALVEASGDSARLIARSLLATLIQLTPEQQQARLEGLAKHQTPIFINWLRSSIAKAKQ